MNHPNIHPFYGFANDKSFGPFGALVSPVSWYTFCTCRPLHLTYSSGVRIGMLPNIYRKMAGRWSRRSGLLWCVGLTDMSSFIVPHLIFLY
jgi:hypothetical protein